MTNPDVTSEAPSTVTAVAKSPVKKKTVSKAKNAPTTHPSTAVMVTSAVKQLNDKKGSSLVAIKKYLAANFNVDTGKWAPFIRRFLRAAVVKGILVQTKGTGASGLFRLPAEAKRPVKKAVTAKKPATKKPKVVKAATSPPKKRKAPAAKTTKSGPAVKKAKKVTKPKTVSKSPAKTTKVPATKTKAPKAKILPVKKTAAPKKK